MTTLAHVDIDSLISFAVRVVYDSKKHQVTQSWSAIFRETKEETKYGLFVIAYAGTDLVHLNGISVLPLRLLERFEPRSSSKEPRKQAEFNRLLKQHIHELFGGFSSYSVLRGPQQKNEGYCGVWSILYIQNRALFVGQQIPNHLEFVKTALTKLEQDFPMPKQKRKLKFIKWIRKKHD